MPPDFAMENSLSYVIFCRFFATSAHQRIIFMVPVKTNKFKILWKFQIFPRSIHGENPKNRYLN